MNNKYSLSLFQIQEKTFFSNNDIIKISCRFNGKIYIYLETTISEF
jgi:hypothetical protein